MAVEPFYSDIQKASLSAFIEEKIAPRTEFTYKVESLDMLEYLEKEADDLLCVIACGIEDCILPNLEYRKKVEGEIGRVLERDAFSLALTAIFYPKGLKSVEINFPEAFEPKK